MLHQIAPAAGSRKKRTRVGRGNGSKGTTCGRGSKGQGSRSGRGKRFGFEGGQTPLLRRQPKLGGFTNPNRKEYEVVNIGDLEQKLEAGSYDAAALRAHGALRTKKPVKLLSRGELKKAFTLTVDAASRAAVEAVKKAGGSVTVPTNKE